MASKELILVSLTHTVLLEYLIISPFAFEVIPSTDWFIAISTPSFPEIANEYTGKKDNFWYLLLKRSSFPLEFSTLFEYVFTEEDAISITGERYETLDDTSAN